MLVVLLLLGDFGAALVQAQERTDSLNLIPRYRMARYRLLAQQFVAQMPMRVLPPEPIPVPVDSLVEPSAPTDTAGAEPGIPSFPIDDVRALRDLERSWFRNTYGDTDWSFLGTGPRLTVLDTTRTRDLRARLQAHFGDPTVTPAEVDLDAWSRRPDSTREDLVQFAYWFVVNDSIPVRVTDVDGPNGRGLIVSTDQAYRDRLRALRAALLAPLRRKNRAPYVDYYRNPDTGRWYRVGFDGESFFREHISRRAIVPGRRPRLETDRTSPASSEPSDSTGASPY
jgi:hypothetical protein